MMQSPRPALTLPLRLRLLGSWLALAWERLWAKGWRTASVLGFVLAIALMDVLPALSGWLHIMVLFGVAGGVGYLVYRDLGDYRLPTWEAAQTRLEQTTEHRPLTAVQDSVAGGVAPSPFQEQLWRLHQERARTNLQKMRSFWPAPGVAARDTYTLRAGAIIALFIAVAGSWGDFGARLTRASWPSWDDTTTGPSVKIWITPPTYTGRSPVFVEWPAKTDGQATKLEVPERSKMLIVVTGTPRETTAIVDDKSLKLEKLADKSQRLEHELPRADVLEVRQRGRTLGRWDIDMIPDMPPSINFVREPREAGRWRLRLDYKARDDYGIEKVEAHIVRQPILNADLSPMEVPTDESIDFELTVPPFNPKEATQPSLHDLTAHPWAGQPVLVQLIVTDQAGQKSPTGFQEVMLPERVFQHPIAKELISIRRELLAGADPKTIVPLAFRKIAAIMRDPQSFGGDPKVHLELATAKYRLAYDEAAATNGTLPPILWAAAVRIEDGNMAVAEQRLEEAEQALKSAMERGAPPEEISRLIDELQRALAQYTKELASRMPEGEQALLNPGKDMQTVGPEELMRMMQEMRQMNQMGAKDAAREMMAELQNMLQALKSMSTQQNNNPDVKAAQDIMRDLKSLTAEQSKLLEETFKQQRESQLKQQNNQDQNNQGNAQDQQRNAAQQEKLRQQLGELMGRMSEATGQVPKSMGNAESNMRQARDALKAGAMKPATDAQAEALAKLQDSMGEANEQLMQSLEQKGLSGMMSMPGDGQTGNDPLGQRNGPNDETQVEIPEAPDTNSMSERVRVILDEIRKRAADRTRPADEQEYLRRLMKQF
jgi:uncharacterized protein (TIGR02302 family)